MHPYDSIGLCKPTSHSSNRIVRRPLRHFGSVSIMISVAKCVTSLTPTHVIDPAHSSNITLNSRNLVQLNKQKIVVRPQQSLMVLSWALIIWEVVVSKSQRKKARPLYDKTFYLRP